MISSLRRGGAEGVCARLAQALAARGDGVSVITLAPQDSDGYPLPSAVRRVGLDLEGESGGLLGGLIGNLRRLRALRDALRRQPDGPVVALLAVTNVLTVLAATGLGRRVVVCERNDPRRQSFGRLWDRLRRWAYPRADLVTINNPAIEPVMRSWGVRDVAAVENPPPPMPGFTAAPDQARRILHVGRLEAQKAQDVLLRAFAVLAGDFPDWRLVIVGDGSLGPVLHRLADELAIAGRIDWIGRTDAMDVLYRTAALFALPSRFEGTPNALLEAMAAGLPVIVSDQIGGGLAHVEPEDNGLVAPVDDVAALSAALRRLMEDADARKRLGAAARRRMHANGADLLPASWDQAFGFG